ncbi:hypothetical protein [Bryobacter aggregatus]|uniref:hypothetical protein n=1 Tax=Bryobacter aggregatus TaxID=360054 RepID=UPI003B515304
MPSTSECPNRQAHSPYVPTTNGCGGQDSWSASFIPNSFGPANFTACCDAHDICYGTCNSNKANCDNAFGDCFAGPCSVFPAGSPLRDQCMQIAALYYSAVVLFGGGPYETSQREACDCCGSSCSDLPCQPGPCGATPSCNGTTSCGCKSGSDRTYCVREIACLDTVTCTTNANCPSGRVCVFNTCCGAGGWCAPLCGGSSGLVAPLSSGSGILRRE